MRPDDAATAGFPTRRRSRAFSDGGGRDGDRGSLRRPGDDDSRGKGPIQTVASAGSQARPPAQPRALLAFEAETTCCLRGGPAARAIGCGWRRAGQHDRHEGEAAWRRRSQPMAEESGRLAYVAASRPERRLILMELRREGDRGSEKPRRSRKALAASCRRSASAARTAKGSRFPPEPRAASRILEEVRSPSGDRRRRREQDAALTRPPRVVAADPRLVEGIFSPLAGR